MTAEKGFRIRFWGVNICAIIPILVVSVVMAIFFTTQNIYQRERSIESEFSRRIAEFEAIYWNYYDKAILLSEKNELRPHRMQGNFIYTKDGIEILQYVNLFDDNIDSVFMEYGDGKIYSDAFFSKLDLFLEIKGYRKENIDRVTRLLSSETAGISIIETQNNESSMLLSFPIEHLNDNTYTVNFLISFEKVVDLFYPDDSWQIFELTCKDGSLLLLQQDENGHVKRVNTTLSEDKVEDFSVLQDMVSDGNLSIKLYYDRTHIIKNAGYFRIQTFNVFLIVLGTVITGFATWMISKRHIGNLFRLEKIACGEISMNYTGKSIYRNLQDILLNINQKLKGYEEEIVFNKMLYKEDLINMLFKGFIVDEDEVRETLQKIGYKPEDFKNFFVCEVYVSSNISNVRELLCFSECLVKESLLEDHCIITCLCPIESSDDINLMNRGMKISQIHDALVEKYNQESIIGASKLHTDITMIGSAAKEATQVLETIRERKRKKYWECWEGLVGNFVLVLPDYSSLKKIEEALENANVPEAEKWMSFLLKEENVSQRSKGNDRYIKHAILQCVVEFFERKNDIKKNEYILKCLQLDIDSANFQKDIVKILDKYCMPMKTDVLSEMLLYIEKNLHRSDLSYEEVAEIGKISKTYISKLFKTKVGMSYIEYVTKLRLEKACLLLRTTNMTMEDIIMQIGYDNASSFRRSFKNKYGIGPSEYRKKWRKQWNDM